MPILNPSKMTFSDPFPDFYLFLNTIEIIRFLHFLLSRALIPFQSGRSNVMERNEDLHLIP